MEIDTRKVVYGAGDDVRSVPADTVIVATGVASDTRLADALREAGFDVHVVGDAGAVGYIEGAVPDGHDVATRL